jgi:ribosome assembly protein 1
MATLLEEDVDKNTKRTDTLSAQDFSDKISYAFQLATAGGPLCQEPMQGVAIFMEEVNLQLPVDESSNARDKLPRLTSEIIKTVRESIHKGFLDWSPRLLLAMYSCEIQASSKSRGLLPSQSC